jgi:hypothetical protein
MDVYAYFPLLMCVYTRLNAYMRNVLKQYMSNVYRQCMSKLFRQCSSVLTKKVQFKAQFKKKYAERGTAKVLQAPIPPAQGTLTKRLVAVMSSRICCSEGLLNVSVLYMLSGIPMKEFTI